MALLQGMWDNSQVVLSIIYNPFYFLSVSLITLLVLLRLEPEIKAKITLVIKLSTNNLDHAVNLNTVVHAIS